MEATEVLNKKKGIHLHLIVDEQVLLDALKEHETSETDQEEGGESDEKEEEGLAVGLLKKNRETPIIKTSVIPMAG